MSMAGWGGIADTGFSGVPPEVQAQVEAYMDEGPPEVAEVPPPFSHSDYDRQVFSMRHFLRPFSAALIGVFLLVALEAVLSQAGPVLLQTTIDDGVLAGDRTLVVTMGLIFGLLVPASIGVGILKTMSAGRVGATIMAKLRVALFSHFQRLGVEYYANERPGRLLSRMTSDLEPLQQLFQQGLVQLAVQGVTLVAITIVLFVLNPLLAVITLVVVVPGTLLMSLWYRHQAQLAQIRVRDAIANVLAHLQESLAGIRIVTAHNRRERVVVEHQNEAGEYLDANDRTAFLNGVYGPGAEAMGPLSQMILLVIGGALVLDGRVTIGELSAFLLYVAAFFAPITELVGLYNVYQQGRASVVKLREVFATEPSVVESPDAYEMPAVKGHIRLDGVTFGYDDDAPVVADVNLEFMPGETIAVVGPTGAGKSTIAKLLNRFYDPRVGTVTIDGHDLTQVTIESLRSQIGVVPQEPFLFAGSIRDNLMLGCRGVDDEVLIDACRQVGLGRLLERLPDGLDTPCHERGVSLSAGERQLLALARAFLSQPRVLVLDEATSSLDLRTEQAVEAALDVVLAGRTAVMIAHRLQTTMRADRIVVIADGGVAESGTRAELIAADGYFARMWAAGAPVAHGLDGSASS
ncbi:MAG: ABC transporter ATP-binding protein [Acidimicrobiaceae bacterium]|nr:ABC transporter ATP-binding protein [Acidimicrobiaceae bacterium]